MKIAIVDDNKREAARLSELIRSYAQKERISVETCGYFSGEDFVQALDEVGFDAVFMDIYMDEMDGIEAARRLWEKDSRCCIIFLTTSREHIWQAVALHSFDYIVKDQMEPDRIGKVLNDVRRHLGLEAAVIRFTAGTQRIAVPSDVLQYIMSDGNYTIFVTRSGQRERFRVRFMDVAEQVENEPNYCLCNRGILVNFDFVEGEQEQAFVMADGTMQPLRRRDAPSLRNQYFYYRLRALEEQQ